MADRKPGFWKHLVTDYDNRTFDTGRSLVVIVILNMCVFQGWDLIVHGSSFNPQSFGTGVAAIIGGLGAYLFGDNAKRPDADTAMPSVRTRPSRSKSSTQPTGPTGPAE